MTTGSSKNAGKVPLADETPAPDAPAEDVPALPPVGTLVRLDDPEDDETPPRFALSAGDLGVIDLPAPRAHELVVHKV